MALRELQSAIAAETEAAVGNTTINYEAASTAVETVVVVAVMDAAVAPEAGSTGSGYGSGNDDYNDNMTAMAMVTAGMIKMALTRCRAEAVCACPR